MPDELAHVVQRSGRADRAQLRRNEAGPSMPEIPDRPRSAPEHEPGEHRGGVAKRRARLAPEEEPCDCRCRDRWRDRVDPPAEPDGEPEKREENPRFSSFADHAIDLQRQEDRDDDEDVESVVVPVRRQTLVEKEEGGHHQVSESEHRRGPAESAPGDRIDAGHREQDQGAHPDSVRLQRRSEYGEDGREVVRFQGASIRGTPVEDGVLSSFQDVLCHETGNRLIGIRRDPPRRHRPPLDGAREEEEDDDCEGGNAPAIPGS